MKMTLANPGTIKFNGLPVVVIIRPETGIIQIDGMKTTGATMGTVIDALRGKPGEMRTLEIERNGASITVTVSVARII